MKLIFLILAMICSSISYAQQTDLTYLETQYSIKSQSPRIVQTAITELTDRRIYVEHPTLGVLNSRYNLFVEYDLSYYQGCNGSSSCVLDVDLENTAPDSVKGFCKLLAAEPSHMRINVGLFSGHESRNGLAGIKLNSDGEAISPPSNDRSLNILGITCKKR